MKILLTGGSGLLGKELRKMDSEIIAPSSEQLDVTRLADVAAWCELHKPDVVIHAAAITDNRVVEREPVKALKTNVIGTSNVATVCNQLDIRMVYLSTDYIYKGDHGLYKETDEILPFNLYAWMKLGGECATRIVKNHLIIRTSFGSPLKGYPIAFMDKYTSKDYVHLIAPNILFAATSPTTGILNLGTDRKTAYQYQFKTNEYTLPISLKDTYFNTPTDTSLNLQKWHDESSPSRVARNHEECRICSSKNMTKYLDLGVMPLANNLHPTAEQARNCERYPLQVLFCNECGLSQTSVIISPTKLFSNYTYRSGVNGGYIKHCQSMAESLMDKWGLNENSLCYDIAGNDGTLLKQFKRVSNCKVLNVDPAENLTAIAESEGIASVTKFWGKDIASDIAKKYGQADFITATNVFAHVPDMRGFLLGVKDALDQDGVFVLEFPYLVDFIEKNEFDTVYFEHLSYISITPLTRLVASCGMQILDIEKFNIHGGTLRVFIAKQTSRRKATGRHEIYLNNELKNHFNHIVRYESWSETVKDIVNGLADTLLTLKKQGKKIACFAASAKGNTLLNAAGITTDLVDFIADETPEKIGKFSPTTGIPILHKDAIQKYKPDYIVILSWNFKDEIIEKLKPIYSGKFIIPIPRIEII